MANIIITRDPGDTCTIIDVDGIKVAHPENTVIPYKPNGMGNQVFLYDKNQVRSPDRITLTIGVDTINVNGTDTWANPQVLFDALKEILVCPPAM